MCEQCHDVPVGKLKAVMDKCRSIYFICKGCDNNMTDITLNEDGACQEAAKSSISIDCKLEKFTSDI